MKDLLVVSDTHGQVSYLVDLIHRHREVDTVLFLGDGLGDLTIVRTAFPDRSFLSVRGNCDGWLRQSLLTDAPATRTLAVEGVTLMMTHGHLFGVKSDLEHLARSAYESGCSIALFGHTHTPCDTYVTTDQKPILMCNPGSLGSPRDGRHTYGILHVDGSQALFGIGEI